VALGGALSAYATAGNPGNISAQPETITFIVGESTIVKAPWPTVRVAVTDPTVADVQALTQDQVLLQGSKVGSTDLIIWSEDEQQVRQWKVQVKLDTASFQEKLDELFPDCSLEVSDFGETLVVTGLLRSTDQTVQLHDFLEKTGVNFTDTTSVAGVQQVLLQIRVAEVSRQALRALGISYFHTDDDWFGAMRGVSTSGATNTSIDIGVPEGTVAGDITPFTFQQDVTAGPLATIFAGVPRADFMFFLNALAENQHLRLLANPSLVALSGEEASFLAGGEFPIPVVQGGSGAGGGTSVSIEYREYGVRVSFTPIVLGDGTIRLQAAPEVSELSDVGAVTIQGFRVPALITRKAASTLELKSGQTFAMAGLLQDNVQAVNSRVPGLGDLPILGPLFRSVRYQKNQTELVVLVTASLVEPMSLAETPPLPGFLHKDPNDWEFFIDGRLESEEPAKISSNDAEWLRQMGLDRLTGTGAWDSYGEPVPSSRAGAQSGQDAEDSETQSSPESGDQTEARARRRRL
jgi:pilus assembly protein CpaC